MLATTLCAAALAACDGGTDSEKLNPNGTVRFTYRGALTGAYEASGELPVQGGALAQPTTGAAAVRQDSVLAVLAFRATGGTRGDGFSLVLGGVTRTGSFSFDPLSCQGPAAGACRVGVFAPGLDAAALTTTPDPAKLAAGAYVLAIGSVNVTRLTKLRVRGTFSGTAVPLSNPTLQNTLTISGGEFDVPIPPR
jgi:hypothetical protein